MQITSVYISYIVYIKTSPLITNTEPHTRVYMVDKIFKHSTILRLY